MCISFTAKPSELVCLADILPDHNSFYMPLFYQKFDRLYAIKVTFNDAPSGGTPSERYFVALVMSAREQYDEANSVMKLAVTLEVDSNVVRVAAAGA